MKTVLLPLDERPCNFKYPKLLFSGSDFEVVLPEHLGDKKVPADYGAIRRFLLRECAAADAAVISMDMLLYGGLIPSRLHHLEAACVKERLNLLRQIKSEHPGLKIYAFQCIMRCPQYSSDDEEPDYYGFCGEEIHRLGRAIHMKSLTLDCGEDERSLREKIPPEALADYEGRRAFNLAFDLEALMLAEEGILDFLIFPQDDSAPYGYTAMDQARVRGEIAARRMQDRVLIYPGADELGLTLLARVMNSSLNRRPRVYVKYASVHAPFLVPKYEDRALGETVRYHLMAAGCLWTESVSEADFVLALSAGTGEMLEAAQQSEKGSGYNVERSLTEFVYALESYIGSGIPVAVGDNAYANGGDLELVSMLDGRGLLLKLAGYAGWNTSANTIGTAIASGVRYLVNGADASHRQFLLLRYLEDAGYCAVVRNHITVSLLPALGMTYFDVRERTGEVSAMVEEELDSFAKKYLSSIYPYIQIDNVQMPWRRMFEADITLRQL